MSDDVDATIARHDGHYNAPSHHAMRFPHAILRKLSSGGASMFDTPRPRLYSGDETVNRSSKDALSRSHHKRLRERAHHRRKTLLNAQAKANRAAKRELKKLTIQRFVSSFKCSAKRLNPASWIDHSEQADNQKVILQLEQQFDDAVEQEEYLKICQKASEQCLQAVRDHHQHFLEDHSDASYEEWIQELHPDNTTFFSKRVVVDHRFYLSDSEHRQLWNENLGNGARSFVPVRHVESKTSSEEDASSSTM